MKIFIYLCCIAFYLTVISARLRLTTPMPSALRINDDVAKQTSNIAEMIDFVNSFLNDDGRSIARRGRYDPMLRRFELPAVKGINLPPSVAVPNDEGTENQLENRADTVRYHVIDNPEVLEEFSNKQKHKNKDKPSEPVISVVTSNEAKSFGTVENKLKYYHSKSNSTASKITNNYKSDEFLHTQHHNPLDSVQKLTTLKLIYRPSFSDDDDDDDGEKPIKEDKESVTEKEISTKARTSTADAKSLDDLKINNTVEIKKRTLDNKAADKDIKAGIDEEKAVIDDTKETGQMKNELPLKKDKNNDHYRVTVGVTINKEKSGSNKENISSKLDNNSNKRQRDDNILPREEDFGNYGNKNINVTTDMNSEKDEKLNERSWDTNERLMGRITKSALRTTQKNKNHDSMEPHSSYSHKEINENRHKQIRNSREKRDKYGKKKKDTNDDRWSKNEKFTNNIFKKRYKKVNGYDRMEYEWNKRHKQYDNNDSGNIKGNRWEKNDDFDSRDRDSNKRDNDWKNRDNYWKKRDKNWKKRDLDFIKRDSDWTERETDSNKRDNDWNKRDKNWNKRDTAWIKQDRPYNVDRDNNHVIRKQNEWEKKNSHTSVETDGDKSHESYEIVERKIKDGDDSRHSEME